MKYAWIKSMSTKHATTLLCQLLDVSSTGYYDWRDRPISPRAKKNQQLLCKIRCFHKASHEIYGSPNIHKDLVESGEAISANRVARLMSQAGIQAKTSKRFVITTNSKNTHQPAPDLLKRNFKTTQKNQAWVSDTTFIKTRQGWLYLATMLDLYSRKIIGWSMSDRNNRELVCAALNMAVAQRRPGEGVIVHSDQGSTYASNNYQKLLKGNKMICSMSRKGNCWDNAVAESFFGSLKTEWVDDKDYQTRNEARKSIFEYIEMFYNRKRRHSYLGYKSPVDFERECVS